MIYLLQAPKRLHVDSEIDKEVNMKQAWKQLKFQAWLPKKLSKKDPEISQKYMKILFWTT